MTEHGGGLTLAVQSRPVTVAPKLRIDHLHPKGDQTQSVMQLILELDSADPIGGEILEPRSGARLSFSGWVSMMSAISELAATAVIDQTHYERGCEDGPQTI